MKIIDCALCLILLQVNNVAAQTSNTIAVEVLTKAMTSWDGTALPEYAEGKPEVSILRIIIPPGTKLPLHKHPVINAGVLLSGELTVVAQDGVTLHMIAGDTIVEVVNKWHYGKNEGNEPAEIIVFYAGIQGEPLSTNP
jgi:quercetin dioxygenase-like cupin family protein